MILLDTHVLLWLVEGRAQLGARARRLIDKAPKEENPLAVSAICFWEIAMLKQKRRLEVVESLHHWRLKVLDLGLLELPITGDIGILAAELPNFHQDPADRIIAATAAVHRATLLTGDDRILGWEGSLRRHDARL